MTVTGFILWLKEEWLLFFPMWTFDVARAIHFYEAVLATLTIIVWHFYSVVFNPDVYPMSWAWINGNLTEHEMELEHGLELERIKYEEEGRPTHLHEGPKAGGRNVYPLHPEGKEKLSIKGLYGRVQGFNESIKKWKGI